MKKPETAKAMTSAWPGGTGAAAKDQDDNTKGSGTQEWKEAGTEETTPKVASDSLSGVAASSTSDDPANNDDNRTIEEAFNEYEGSVESEQKDRHLKAISKAFLARAEKAGIDMTTLRRELRSAGEASAEQPDDSNDIENATPRNREEGYSGRFERPSRARERDEEGRYGDNNRDRYVRDRGPRSRYDDERDYPSRTGSPSWGRTDNDQRDSYRSGSSSRTRYDDDDDHRGFGYRSGSSSRSRYDEDEERRGQNRGTYGYGDRDRNRSRDYSSEFERSIARGQTGRRDEHDDRRGFSGGRYRDDDGRGYGRSSSRERYYEQDDERRGYGSRGGESRGREEYRGYRDDERTAPRDRSYDEEHQEQDGPVGWSTRRGGRYRD